MLNCVVAFRQRFSFRKYKHTEQVCTILIPSTLCLYYTIFKVAYTRKPCDAGRITPTGQRTPFLIIMKSYM
jgi:hypothetical protein